LFGRCKFQQIDAPARANDEIGFEIRSHRLDQYVHALRRTACAGGVANNPAHGIAGGDRTGAYEPLPGLHINGELTQGENIADIGGVKLAYAALQKALAGKPQEKIDGFTPEQRFFLSFATIWKSKQRDEDLKLRLNTDPHSPARYRVDGPLSNLTEFAKAFNIPDNSPMVRPTDKRVNIW